MSQIHLSTRKGKIKSLVLYDYRFENHLLKVPFKLENHKKWVSRQSEIEEFDFTPNGVRLVREVNDPGKFLLVFKSNEFIEPPFPNTSLVSGIIAGLLSNHFSKSYKQFENKNIFIVESNGHSPFLLLKCFEFNVEVFENGEFYIHFLPVSKIVSEVNPITTDYFKELLKRQNTSKLPDDLTFSLVNQQKYFRKRFDLLDPKVWEHLNDTLIQDPNYAASFDYHFLAGFDPEIFGGLAEDAQKELEPSVRFIHNILKEVELPENFNLDSSTFLDSEKSKLLLEKNLRVGMITEPISIISANKTQYGLRVEFCLGDNDEIHFSSLKNLEHAAMDQIISLEKPIKGKGNPYEIQGKTKISQFFKEADQVYSLVEKQSQSFFTGIYKPAWKGTILPVLLNVDKLDQFKELVKKFNPLANEFKILPELLILLKKDDPRSIVELIQQEVLPVALKIKGKFLIAVFTKYTQPNDTFKPLKKYPYQVYKGMVSEKSASITLSNFVCKCLEKLGGQVAAINNTFLNESGIFFGIDLGHSTHGVEKKTNLGGVTFDNHGNQIGKFVVNDLPRKENLTKEGLDQLIIGLKNKMANKFPRNLSNVVIHRDGKLHSEDLNLLEASIKEHWGFCEIDVVEIIKSGFPLMVERNSDKKLCVPESGSFFVDEKNKYAVIITNDQVREKGQSVNPIIIKHKMGNLDFIKVVEQVYWFTRVHTQGIHNPTRLPATTLKANNIVSTSNKTHVATYLG
jgi:hypothetical protein